MRILTTDKEEKHYRCPECKVLLAYTEDDIKEDISVVGENEKYFEIQTRKSVTCPACRYNNVLSITTEKVNKSCNIKKI